MKTTRRTLLTAFSALALSAGMLSIPAVQAEKGEVELAYVEWSSEVASTNVIKVVLENLGYEVKITSVSGAAMWQAVGDADVDGMVAAWLPTTHSQYLEKVKDNVEDLGPNLIGTKVGLVVPTYVTIDSVAEINDHAEKFDNKIVGIDPGAGMMGKTETLIEEYGLTDIKLIEGSGATMTATLGNSIDSKEWIVVTGWTPHWKFARWDLKYLEDPKNIYGGEEEIHTIVRKGLKADMPEVYRVLDQFKWTPEQMGALMSSNREDDADPYENAKKWVEANAELVSQWTSNTETASKK